MVSGTTISTTPETIYFPPVTGTQARLLFVESTKTPSIWEWQIFYTNPTKPSYLDLTGDGLVDLPDLAWLLSQWLFGDCDQTCNCDKADLYHDSHIDLRDFAVLQARLGESP